MELPRTEAVMQGLFLYTDTEIKFIWVAEFDLKDK